ncbi:arginase family protein [Brevibacillus brevis]|uniref:arginase family protein n=1 Tax=Brevibacillus brevis TaxID=1393 RepID=UPI000D10F303|nr:arginase family protein [Brevibacillus brevis]PSJ70937.1 arginase [Brevibacillus brevis]RED24290.1 arginase family enzyme [Brevibacillus brevis]GEC91938.1 arginase [Brevibacillus brevis]VEF91879.1 Arginase [Brevibacillus brevis]
MAGIPHFTGAYVSGTELAPDALRTAGLIEQLQQHGLDVQDVGNLHLPDDLPRHNIPPVRNWPAPRMFWDLLQKDAQEWLDTDDFVLMLGGDCSLVVATAQAHQARYQEKAYLLVLDGHLDAVVPSASRCIGAAGMGLWFLLQDRGQWIEPSGWNAERIRLVGCQQMPGETFGVDVMTLAQLTEGSIVERVSHMLQSIPPDAKILIHFDVDIMHKDAMPAAYSPSEIGLSLSEAEALLATVLRDSRVTSMEVTEFSGARDTTGEYATRLVELLARALAARA